MLCSYYVCIVVLWSIAFSSEFYSAGSEQRPRYCSEMWSETVGLRTKPVWDHKIGLGLGIGLGLAGLVLCCETRSCPARRHNDLEGHNNFSSTIYSLCSKHHYCGDRSHTEKLNPPIAFVYFRWSWFCYFGLRLGLKNLVLFTSLILLILSYWEGCWLAHRCPCLRLLAWTPRLSNGSTLLANKQWLALVAKK